MLKEAKSQCDWLIACLQTDPTIDRPNKNKPVQTLFERFIQVRACKYVDELLVYTTEDEVIEILKAIDHDVRIIGEDYDKSATNIFLYVSSGTKTNQIMTYFKRRDGRQKL